MRQCSCCFCFSFTFFFSLSSDFMILRSRDVLRVPWRSLCRGRAGALVRDRKGTPDLCFLSPPLNPCFSFSTSQIGTPLLRCRWADTQRRKQKTRKGFLQFVIRLDIFLIHSFPRTLLEIPWTSRSDGRCDSRFAFPLSESVGRARGSGRKAPRRDGKSQRGGWRGNLETRLEKGKTEVES